MGLFDKAKPEPAEVAGMALRCVVRLVAVAALLSPLVERAHGASVDRRVVDVVNVGDADSEARHGFTASDTLGGRVGERSYRVTRGWLHYTLAIFEDTELAVSLAFVRPGEGSYDYEVVVEDSVVARRTLGAATHAATDVPVVVEIPVPLSVTKGKTSVSVVLRARVGRSPALHQLRTIQDHNELQ